MSTDAPDSGTEQVDHHPDDVLFPPGSNRVLVSLGKEALLSWFTDVRSQRHAEAIDRFQHLSRSRATYDTSVYQLAEAVTKVRYEDSPETVADLERRIVNSSLRVRHGSDDWSDTHLTRAPKDVFGAVTGLFEDRRGMEVSFPEAALVLGLARETYNRSIPAYLFTFDGTLATLADTFDVPVLPYSTPLRDDTGR